MTGLELYKRLTLDAVALYIYGKVMTCAKHEYYIVILEDTYGFTYIHDSDTCREHYNKHFR